MLEGVDGNFAEEQELDEEGRVVARSSSTSSSSSSSLSEEEGEDAAVQRRRQQPVSIDDGRDGRPEEEDGELSYFSPANATLSTVYRLLVLHKTSIPPSFPPVMKTKLLEGDRLVDEREVFEVGKWLEERIVDAKLENGEDVECVMLEDGCQQLVSLRIVSDAVLIEFLSVGRSLKRVASLSRRADLFPSVFESDPRRRGRR